MSFSVLFVILTFCFLLLKIFTGKSIRNPIYPPVKGTVFNQLFYFNRLYDYQTEVAKEQPTFRLLAPDQSEVYTTDMRNIEHVLKTNFAKYSKGKYNQDIVSDVFGQGIFVVDGEKWKQQRKLASFEFSTRVLRDFSCSVFRRNSAKLVRVVSEILGSNQSFDMQDILMRCTLDSIIKVGFGIDLNCLEGSSKEGTAFMKAFDDSTALSYWRYVDPFWKLKRVLNIGSEAALKKNVRIMDDFVHQLIKSKRTLVTGKTDANDREDILSRFLLESEKDPEKMNDTYLRDIILNFMIAGKDTSANTLSWFLYMLTKNPLIQEKVAQEVRDVVGFTIQVDEANIDELVENITDANLDKMHYLHATITETLRLYPAVPVDGRCAEVDDILPDGFRLRKGDGVYYMAYAMGRMPYIWGEDAEDFRPERWLKNGIFQPESPFKFVAFHAGPRICLGKDFAYRQMKIVSTALLFFFRFKLADETKNVTYRTMFTLHMDGGIFLVDGEKWKQQRKLASFEFSTRVLRDVSCSVFRRNAAKLVRVVFGISSSGGVFDMQDLLMRCTLDSIFKVGFGIELHCLERSSQEGTAFMKAFDESTALTYFRYIDPFWKLKRIFNLGHEASLKKYVKVMDDFVNQVISSKRRLQEEQKDVIDKEDILSRFLLESANNPEEMNDKYLRDIILNFMFAGKDTSAITLSWFFYMLSKNPLIQEKVVQEVRDVVGNQVGEAKVDEFVENITEETLERMHYLHAALTETLRLYPAVPIDGRCADVDDILPDGFRVRKGDNVNYITYAMGRMPYIWGKDADDFRPERWLKNGIFQPESPFKFVAFHAGPRICLGKDFAYRQMKIVAMALLSFFRFKLADETKPVTYRTMFTLHIDGSLPMIAVPRTT
ncbi:cytochrome P450 704C1-like [Pyrus ussuriensis x Pyrus communis]|uniref:Cytochrome P450 704C1-like n=1 Tax=Pyrus ussuriensis x Pyrus communis TaxID=2448454 RepID=A0A5N5HKP3_9ROSA|nr:cytochrome P450 704C1-like [Pyrus ussuriensis x Pyrus communis]